MEAARFQRARLDFPFRKRDARGARVGARSPLMGKEEEWMDGMDWAVSGRCEEMRGTGDPRARRRGSAVGESAWGVLPWESQLWPSEAPK